MSTVVLVGVVMGSLKVERIDQKATAAGLPIGYGVVLSLPGVFHWPQFLDNLVLALHLTQQQPTALIRKGLFSMVPDRPQVLILKLDRHKSPYPDGFTVLSFYTELGVTRA